VSSSSLHARTSSDLTLFLLLYIVVLFADLSDVKITLTLLTWFVHDTLDFAVDISRLQNVRNGKVLSTS
jgi:hypothetical protein